MIFIAFLSDLLDELLGPSSGAGGCGRLVLMVAVTGLLFIAIAFLFGGG